MDAGGFFPSGNTIQNNVIRFNDLDGVRINGASTTATTLTQNAIYSNDGLGIDLNGDGVTANDVNDADTGPNDLLNFPFVLSVLEAGGLLTANLRLDLPGGSYRIEFFKNPSGADPSGNGEGEVFVATRNITHPGGGPADFNHSFPGVVGDAVTTTTTFCTDGPPCAACGSTSEFSNAVTSVTTAVKLTSFDAVARDGAVDLLWKTGSELNNLGFHLYRSLAANGPYERITDSVIPGLGSSPVGASYNYRDAGLTNKTRYFYKLKDIETSGRTELHGPVSAVPEEESVPEEEERTRETEKRVAYGDPSEVSLRVLERGPNGAVIELVTGGFFATRVDGGAYRLEVPGFEEIASANLPAIPIKRLWLDALVHNSDRGR